MNDIVLAAVAAVGVWLVVFHRRARRHERALAHHLVDVSEVARDVMRNRVAWRLRDRVTERCERMVTVINAAAASRSRSRQIGIELPVVLDFVVLCLSAGVSTADALYRVGAVGGGALAAECRVISAQHSLGMSLTDALRESARRHSHTAWNRTVDHIVDALDRGTPLVGTLVALAAEERAAATRAVIESGSVREVAMLVPLVFVILPVTVIFAVFPGIMALEFVV